VSFSPLLKELVESLRVLPGVGRKTAQRMAFHLLERDREGARRLADRLREAVERVGHCERCRMLTEESVCGICRSPNRDPRLVCVVETPADVLAIEDSGAFTGQYFVLMGHLSPLDGIGPEALGLDRLAERLAAGEVEELILATGTTVEGDATAQLIGELAAREGVAASRIAHGVPIGGDLEYVDAGTLSRAMTGRLRLRSASGAPLEDL
jgi:recombination protein RecR